MDNKELILSLQNELAILLPEESSRQLRPVLAAYINQLLDKNFEKLINLLYRLDVNENKLKQLLKDNADIDAALLIADLIIERQLQKIRVRNEFKKKETGESNEDEKW
ncbi:MAG: hypothetical protein JST09_00520 [Bacteroidetes bacterium]|nr:hypothetical protein [Bacteroidota bacterium]MBS1607517.1 hypothetical protein [Bacteroidota bacterium]